MNYRENFAENFSKLRSQHMLSQAELAGILSVTSQAVSLLEKGKRSPSFEVLCTLADYFGVSIDYLVGRDSYATEREHGPIRLPEEE